jgi:asparaginyl-tRNA synthetase
MKKVTVKELIRNGEQFLDQEVQISGWVRKIRSQKSFGFIELNDGSFFTGIQVVFEENLENFDEISRVSIATSMYVTGTFVKSEGKGQSYEIKATSVEIFQKADLDYPLQNKRHTFEYLRSIAHLRPRTNAFSAVFRVRSLVAYAIHKFFQDQEFVYVHTPIITGSDAEGAGEMFRVTTLDLNETPKTDKGEIDYKEDFFGKETNLTVSGQLNVETYCAAFRNVYTFGPTFRAENSNTTRHASEFWMIEPEIAFAALEANMDLAEEMVKYIIKYVLEKAPEEMEFFNKFVEKGLFDKLNNVLVNDFARVTYTEAVDILLNSKKKFEFKVEWGIDLQSEHERFLAEEHFKRPVFVTDYPKDIKAFYMKLNEDGKTVRAMDLLAPGIGEIIGGSQREDNLEELERRMDEVNLPKEDYKFYTDLRKYGSFPHSGYGLGFERMIMYVTGMTNKVEFDCLRQSNSFFLKVSNLERLSLLLFNLGGLL